MGYVDSNLIPGEHVVSRGRIHGIVFAPGIIFSITVIGLIIGIPLLIWAVIYKNTTEMAVTDKRVIIKRGWISRNTLEMNLAKIENIGINQGLFGRMFNYGDLTVVGTGGTHERFWYVADPLEFRRAVQAQAEATRSAA